MDTGAMTKTGDIVVMPDNTRVSVTPMELLNMAVAKGADLAQLEKLMDLQERWEKNEARKAFVSAMTAFKATPPVILKNKQVSFSTAKGITEYKHATLDQVSQIIGEALSAVGISHRWEVDQLEGGAVKVTCVLTHSLGHSERVPMQAGLDQSGGKNNIQALGSVVTYLQRYTLLSAAGMAVKDQDDDARGAVAEHTAMTTDATDVWLKMVNAAETMDAVKATWKQAAQACKEIGDSAAHAAIKKAVTARLAALAAQEEV